MASVIRRRVLQALADYLTALAPEVDPADVVVGVPGTTRAECFPNIVIKTDGPYTFEPLDDDELWTTTTTQWVQVGEMVGSVEVTIGATDQNQREELEDRVLNDFFEQTSSDGSPRRGVLVIQLDGFNIGERAALGVVPVAYILRDDVWRDEMVFDRKRYSSLMLDVEIPALCTREVPDIEVLVLAITDDLDSTDPDLDYQVAVDEDGVVTPYP